MRTRRFILPVATLGIVTVAFCLSTLAQQTRGKANDTGDFTEGNLRFHRVGGFIQVTDIDKKQVAGTIIVQADGALMYAPMPGYDIKAAYEKHMNGGGSEPPAANAANDAATNSSPAAVSATSKPGWDEASRTVTLSAGRHVTFTDNEHATVVIPGDYGTKAFQLEYHKASAGGFGRSLARYGSGGYGSGSGLGGPLSGSVEISENGMKLYDTNDGTSRGMRDKSTRIQPIVDAVQQASDVAKVAHPEIPNEPVVKTLLNNLLTAPSKH